MFKRRSFCAITGASRGLGRAAAAEFAAKLAPGSVLAVFARNKDQLLELKTEINASHPQVTVYTVPADLGTQPQQWYDTIFRDIVKETAPGGAGDFEQAILINNAASFMGSKKAIEFTDKKWLDEYYSLNVSSIIMMTSQFLTLFTSQLTSHRYVVNVSSCDATVPEKYMSAYCAGKAGRLMFYRVLAVESPDVRVLSYDPGEMDTDMQADYRNNIGDPGQRQRCLERHRQGLLLTAQESANYLKETLEKDVFTSGDEVSCPGRY